MSQYRNDFAAASLTATPAAIDTAVRHAHTLRSNAFRDAFGMLFDGTRRAFRTASTK